MPQGDASSLAGVFDGGPMIRGKCKPLMRTHYAKRNPVIGIPQQNDSGHLEQLPIRTHPLRRSWRAEGQPFILQIQNRAARSTRRNPAWAKLFETFPRVPWDARRTTNAAWPDRGIEWMPTPGWNNQNMVMITLFGEADALRILCNRALPERAGGLFVGAARRPLL